MSEWQQHPKTLEFRKHLERKLEEIGRENFLNLDSVDNTALSAALKEGRIRAILEVIEDIREGFGGD